jgi:hypothetical protein
MNGILLGILIGSIILILIAYRYAKKENSKTIIPFKESVDLVGMPIVTFTNNGEKLHFLLDTGSDDSYIIPSVLDKLVVLERTDKPTTIIMGSGNMDSLGEVALNISYKDYVFTNIFKIQALEDAFKSAFASRGVTVHGILGSIFFNKYNYILDFKELEATSRYGKKNNQT